MYYYIVEYTHKYLYLSGITQTLMAEYFIHGLTFLDTRNIYPTHRRYIIQMQSVHIHLYVCFNVTKLHPIEFSSSTDYLH